MLKYFNKDKKKQPQLQNIPSPDEFFSKGQEYEISNEFWKMNATQLEEACKKQEKFISHLKKQYISLLELLESEKQKQEDELKKLNNQIEELQIKNQSNIQQKELMESQFKEMYEKQNPPTTTDLLDLGNPEKEEIQKLRDQCSKVCEEMRRLQEDNDDVSLALETEKNYNKKQIAQKQQLIDDMQLQINQYEEQLRDLNLNKLKLEQNLEQNSQLDHQMKDLESKLLQERIKSDQKQRDCVRLEEIINDHKKNVESMASQLTAYEGKIKLLEQKRQKDKQTILQTKKEYQECRQNLQEQNLLLVKQVEKLTIELEENKNAALLLEQKQQECRQLKQQCLEKEVYLNGIENRLNEQQSQYSSLQKHIKTLEEQNENKVVEQDKLIKHLQLKRENAKLEIDQLNQKIVEFRKMIDSIKTKTKNSEVHTIIKTGNELLSSHSQVKTGRRIQIFPTLHKCLQELRKVEDACYKAFISLMLNEFKNQDEIVKQERMLNDIQRRSQDMIDLLDEIGLH